MNEKKENNKSIKKSEDEFMRELLELLVGNPKTEIIIAILCFSLICAGYGCRSLISDFMQSFGVSEKCFVSPIDCITNPENDRLQSPIEFISTPTPIP